MESLPISRIPPFSNVTTSSGDSKRAADEGGGLIRGAARLIAIAREGLSGKATGPAQQGERAGAMTPAARGTDL
jgi:hypothetical protein